jgi:hypothetical protein
VDALGDAGADGFGVGDGREEAVETVADSGDLGAEIDVQLGQMTLRSKHLMALPTPVANDADVRLIFGDATMQVRVRDISNAAFCGA